MPGGTGTPGDGGAGQPLTPVVNHEVAKIMVVDRRDNLEVEITFSVCVPFLGELARQMLEQNITHVELADGLVVGTITGFKDLATAKVA